MTTIECLDPDGERRWWRVGRFEVDLSSTGVYPANVRALALAHRDADDEEGRNVAAFLAAQVDTEDFSPHPLTSGWLFAQSQKIHARIWDRIHRLEGITHERAA